MIAIVDCNTFYASCERIFAPQLKTHPIVVLSNNDGCVIALTAEAKALGIKRGAPYFEIRGVIKVGGVKVFSSNYALYHSISQRIMAILAEFSPQIEVYSIDEAWLNMDGLANRMALATQIRAYILQGVKMPVSIGIAPTKTLAKIANKKGKALVGGVFEMSDPAHIERILSDYDIADIWGIGRQLNKKLNQHGIHTALQLRNVDSKLARKIYNVGLERTVRELRGEACIDFETAPLPRMIMVCRMFGHKLYNQADIGEALCKYAAEGAKKLRANGLVAKQMTIFTQMSGKHGEHIRGYSTRYQFPSATDSTIDFSQFALAGLKQIFRPGKYMRAGIQLDMLTLKSATQFNLFGAAENPKHTAIMGLMDKLNAEYGTDTIGLAAAGIKRGWKMKQKMLSPRSTTRWEDMPKVR